MSLGVVIPSSGCGPGQLGEADLGVSINALSSSDVARVTVAVSGPGISPDIVADLVNTSGQWRGLIGGIPVGAGRTFTAGAYDASGALLYSGQVTGITITQAGPVSVLILLQQAVPPAPFTNSAPRIVSLVISAPQFQPGQTASLTVTAVDDDGDPLSYAWSATGGTLAGADTANPTWTAPDVEGAYAASVSVTDGRGGQAGVSLVLSVLGPRGRARVEVAFNAWPVVSRVTADPGQVGVGHSAALDVTAVDADGQPLSYAWTDSCGGSFSSTSVRAPTWTAPATAPAGGACTLAVAVSDGQGGSTTGSLVVHVGLPAVPNAPPVIDWTFQSADVVDQSGGWVTVSLTVAGHDPEGTALTFDWSADGGTLGAPVTGAGRSDVVWTPPPTSGFYSVTAVVRDAGGAQWAYTFTFHVIGAFTVPVPIAAAWGHSLAVKADGTLWATGFNGSGQVGDGTAVDRALFGQVLAGVAGVAAGWDHSLAVKVDGTLWGAGANGAGQLGDVSPANQTSFVFLMNGVSLAAAGAHHSLALRPDGTLWATGYNFMGQLGDGTNEDRHGFVQVMSGVSSVAAGWYHTLALKSDGTLWATGYNNVGQLGDGTNTSRNTFVQVMSGVSSVAAGVYHTVVVKTDGTLWGTGYNGEGELGDGTQVNHNGFVPLMSGVSSVATGNYHTLAVKTDGTLWGTGYDAFGQLGDGANLSRTSFVQVMSGVSHATGGMEHSVVMKTDGTLWSAGHNDVGQLGDGSAPAGRNVFAPVPLP